MKLDIGGEETIRATVEQLWSALNDPLVLTRCIPGCKTMTEIAPDNYKVEMQLRRYKEKIQDHRRDPSTGQVAGAPQAEQTGEE